MKTLKQWEGQLEQVLLNIRGQFITLGGLLYHAQKELSHADYLELLSYVEQYGLKDSDIKSAIAAFLHTKRDQKDKDGKYIYGTDRDHRIDPALVFAGAKNSKILFMDEQDQQRLLSGEKFQVIMPNGKADSKPKTWKDMSELQRNMLIGKNGKILTIGEQLDNLRGKDKAALYRTLEPKAPTSGTPEARCKASDRRERDCTLPFRVGDEGDGIRIPSKTSIP